MFDRTDMLRHPRFLAHSSAIASNRPPVPLFRAFSDTTKPCISARSSTSRTGSKLTCSQPSTPLLSDSATNTACCDCGFSCGSLRNISAALAGYPSCPLNSAIRGASMCFARRILTSFRLAGDAIRLYGSRHNIQPLPFQSRCVTRIPNLKGLVGIKQDRNGSFIHQLH